MKKISLCLLALLLCAQFAAAQKVPVQEIVLDNGMRVLLVPRKGDPKRRCRLDRSRWFGQRTPGHYRVSRISSST